MKNLITKGILLWLLMLYNLSFYARADTTTTVYAVTYGIQRLVRVTDTEGNVTTSTYDLGDRRTEVNHPASGITSFTYDALGNVLTKQTANLAKEGKFITYDYDYQRLTGINYPDHPENNVKTPPKRWIRPCRRKRYCKSL